MIRISRCTRLRFSGCCGDESSSVVERLPKNGACSYCWSMRRINSRFSTLSVASSSYWPQQLTLPNDAQAATLGRDTAPLVTRRTGLLVLTHSNSIFIRLNFLVEIRRIKVLCLHRRVPAFKHRRCLIQYRTLPLVNLGWMNVMSFRQLTHRLTLLQSIQCDTRFESQIMNLPRLDHVLSFWNLRFQNRPYSL